MKTGRYGPDPRNYNVKLPQEIVAVILLRIRAFPEDDERRRTLWSCCLLSKSWYSAAIPHLYQFPRLSNRNFDKFTRTLCPPVNSRVRRIGLENFVIRLDLGQLAYESTKSLTARLLRRTRESLESFVAPAVSFSVTCLAPLSKCYNLRSLDLSRDHYDIDLAQLLNAIRNLTHLTALSLPRNAMSKRCNLSPITSGDCSWPIKLASLQINDVLPQEQNHWREFLASWPPCLTSLAFEDCLNWNPFFLLHSGEAVAGCIRALRIGMRREEDGFPMEILMVAFPRLMSLAIPTPVRVVEFTYTLSGLPGRGFDLTSLMFRQAPDSVQPKPKITTFFLLKCVEVNPKLVRVEVPEDHLQITKDSTDDLERIENLTNARSTDPEDAVGLFLTQT